MGQTQEPRLVGSLWLRAAPVGALFAVVLLAAWGLATPAAAFHGLDTERLAGDDRVATAVAVAHEAYPDGTDAAVIARAGAFPDALAAAPLAHQLDAPVLLTDQDALSAATGRALDELGVTRAVIVGGPAAVGEDVAADLRQRVATVERVAGQNRYATAAAIARRIAATEGGIGDIGARRAAFLANGARFADALAASSPAASKDNPVPILLTQQGSLPEATRQAVRDLGIERLFVLGGTKAIAPRVPEQLTGQPPYVAIRRLAGDNRQETATAVASLARGRQDAVGIDAGFGYPSDQVVLVRGDAFPDALAAGPLAGLTEAPILLTAGPNTLGEFTEAFLVQECPVLERITVVGGPAAVSEQAVADAAACHQGRPDQDYTVSPLEPVTLRPGESYEFDGPSRENPWFVHAVDLALFPCDNVGQQRIGGTSAWRFGDADGDGLADGLGSTNTGHAVITRIEGHEAGTRVLREVGPEHEGGMEFTLASDAPDCTFPVAFHDANDNGQLDVDAAGLPLEFYGLTKARWR